MKNTVGLAALGAISLIVVIFLLAGLITQLLWNVLLPELFGFPSLSYWQGVGIYILAGIFRGRAFHTTSK